MADWLAGSMFVVGVVGIAVALVLVFVPAACFLELLEP